MPKLIDREIEGMIKGWKLAKFSYMKIISKLIETRGIKLTRTTIRNIINGLGERRKAITNGIVFRQTRRRTKRTTELIDLVKEDFSAANPPYLRQYADEHNVDEKTIRNIIHKDLNYRTLKKRKTFPLTEPQKKRRNTNSIKLLRKLMANKEFLVTLDESWMHFRKSDGQRSLHYVTKGEKPNPDHVYEPNQLHPKQVMMIGIVCGRGPISLKEVPEKTTVDAEYFIKHVLKPLVEEDLPKFYNRREMQKVYIHYDMAPVHTSKLTFPFINSVFKKTGIQFISKSDMIVKGADVSPLDFWGFGHLKQKYRRMKPQSFEQMKKFIHEIWATFTKELIEKVFTDWARRLQLVINNKGGHIENVSKIHRRSVEIDLEALK